MTLQHRGEWVIEFDRAERKAAKDGAKSDALDAIRAGREALGRTRLAEPRAHSGMREAIRVHTVTRAAAVRARTAAINELKALIVTADESLRHELRGLRTERLRSQRARRFRDRRQRRGLDRTLHPQPRCAPSLGASNILDAEVDDHDRALKRLLDEAAPQLLAERGIGYVTAAAVLHRLVTPRPLPQRSRLRPTRRHLTGHGHVRTEPDPSPPQPRRRPSTQPGALPRRRHQAALLTRPPRPTSPDESARARPNAKPSDASNASSPASVWRLLEHPPITT